MIGPIERVVVPLDAASESQTAIETAARLAARTKAPLHGVFVEDEDLLHLAGLPFARQVTLEAGAEPLTTEHLQLHLQAAAERARKDLLAAAKRHGVERSFEIVRGASQSALFDASEHDLVVARALTRPTAGHFRVECRWWSSIDVAPGPFLLARHMWSASGGVVAVLRDRGPASVRLLDAAAQVAEASDRVLTVICPAGIAGTQGFDKWLSDRIAGHAVRLQIEVAPPEPTTLEQRLSELNCRLLAIEAGLAEGGGDRLREFVERVACDILIVH